MEWLQKFLSNAVYGADGKLDGEASDKKMETDLYFNSRSHEGNDRISLYPNN